MNVENSDMGITLLQWGHFRVPGRLSPTAQRLGPSHRLLVTAITTFPDVCCYTSFCQCFQCAYLNLQGPRLTLEELSELVITPDEDLLERLRKRAAGEDP
jgi:hypothetical protein